jgi:transcriptional regulator with XRE-family HTH domain
MKISPEPNRDAEAVTQDRVALGKRLLSARKHFGWSLAQVAELSGISTTTISRAERGQLVLSYEKFTSLAKALQMDLGAMFGDSRPKQRTLDRAALTRADEGVSYKGLAMTYKFLGTQAVDKQMIPMIGTVHARRIEGPDDYDRHEGEEFVYVLSGIGEVHFETGEVHRLHPGDFLYFDSRIGHAYISVSKQLCRGIGACTTESKQMLSARQGHSFNRPKKKPVPAAGRSDATGKAAEAATAAEVAVAALPSGADH